MSITKVCSDIGMCCSGLRLQAREVVISDTNKSELFLNEDVAIPNYALDGIGSRPGRVKTFDFLASVGATGFFSDSRWAYSKKGDIRDAKESLRSRKVRYGVGRELDGFPAWTATFVAAKRVGVQDVYDISVPVTESFIAMGITVHNCAPEVYHSSKFTPPSDVYSLVIVLWELINRIIKGVYEAPYSEYKHLQYDFQIIIQVAKKGLRPTIPPTTPPQLVDLLKRGMDADPEKRPGLREFVEKLTAFHKEFAVNSQLYDKALLDGRALSRGEKTLSSLGLNQPAPAGN